MKYIYFALIVIVFQSCKGEMKQAERAESTTKMPGDGVKTDSSVHPNQVQVKKDSLNEAMLIKDISFNGQLKRLFSLNDFERVFGKPDSTKLMIDEEPCAYVFENADGSKDQTDRYLYKNGSRFENSGTKVALDEFRFSREYYLLYKGKRIDSKSKLADIEKLFPNAVRNKMVINVQHEGELDYIELREDLTGISDGHIRLFFKADKVYFMHWWFPC